MAKPDSDSESDTGSFRSATDGPPASEQHPRFTPAEEAAFVKASNEAKTHANGLFAQAAYAEAIQAYDRALAPLPAYLDFEVAVLRSNVAACHVKLQEWKDAVEAATKSLEGLERLDPTPKQPTATAKGADGKDAGREVDGGSGVVVEEVDDETAARIEALAQSGRTRADVQRIRIKALLRRAKAREELGGWMDLQGADEDYKLLSTFRDLAPLDRQAVQRALRSLPPRLEAAKQAEMGEMIGKLKDMGNGFLKNFGLSTDNFQFVKDEKSGGYSMNFQQNR